MKVQRGFTIAELLIVVIIAGVLAAIALPNMSEFVKNNTRATRVNTMVTALNYARGQAVTRNTRVSLCKSSGPNFPNFNACDAIGTGDFATGWIVFTDGPPLRGTLDGTDIRLRVFQPDMGGFATLVGVKNDPSVFIGGLTYENTGLGLDSNLPLSDPVISPDTMFIYCDDRGPDKARAILISPTGYPSLTRDTDDDGTDDIGGVKLDCP